MVLTYGVDQLCIMKHTDIIISVIITVVIVVVIVVVVAVALIVVVVIVCITMIWQRESSLLPLRPAPAQISLVALLSPHASYRLWRRWKSRRFSACRSFNLQACIQTWSLHLITDRP